MAVRTLKIHGARFIMTLDPERRIIKDGSILIEGQRIVQVGKASALADVPADHIIDAREMVVTPGFVNVHTHISYPHATRGIFPDDLGAGCMSDVYRLHGAMTEEEEYYTMLLGATELLKYGTTCLLHPGDTLYLDACMQAYEEAGCRAIVGINVTDQPNAINVPVYSTSEALAVLEKTVRDYDHRLQDRVRAWVMLFYIHACSRALAMAAKRLADEYGTGLTFHQAQSPLEYLEDLGVLGPNVLVAHGVAVSDAQIEAMVRTQTKGLVRPVTAMRFAQGLTVRGTLPEMLERGVCMGIGADSSDLGLVEILHSMYLVAMLFKDARQNPKLIPAETAVEMATIKGAEALGLEKEIGAIAVGKKADLVLFDTQRPEWRTLFNPVNNLVYNADGRSVHTVIVDGRVVVEAHKPTFVDEWELIQKAQEIGERILARTGISVPSRWPVV